MKPEETHRLVLWKDIMAFNLNLPRAALSVSAAIAILTAAGAAQSDPQSCPVTYWNLKSALVLADKADTSGFNNHFWAVVGNRAGVVCAVTFSGPDTGSQWLSSRQIAAAKAFTANGLMDHLARRTIR
jgi:hypothetical protein